MRVGVVDVGSNTVRLLVTERRGGVLVPVDEEKAYVGLGAEILRHGAIGAPKLAEAVAVAREQAAVARAAGSELLEVVVAAPGRQAANADELVHELARATRALDKAVTKGVLHRRTAARKISRLARAVGGLAASRA